MADVILGMTLSPRVMGFPWSAGFGTKYSDPGTAMPSAVRQTDFAANDETIALGGQSVSPYIHAYAWSAGFGSKYSNPAAAAAAASSGAGNRLSWLSSGAALFVTTGATSPNVNAWAWSAGFGSKYGNPSPAVGLPCNSVVPSPTNGAVAMATQGAAPYCAAYAWSAGFGTKYSNPGTGLPYNGLSTVFTAESVVFGCAQTPFIRAYAWSDASGFGTVYSAPGSLLAYGSLHLSHNARVATILSIGGNNLTANSLNAYPWSSGFGTKYANPSPALANVSNTGGMTAAGDAVIASYYASPYAYAYAWANGFGSRYSDPGTTPAPTYAIDFTNTPPPFVKPHGLLARACG